MIMLLAPKKKNDLYTKAYNRYIVQYKVIASTYQMLLVSLHIHQISHPVMSNRCQYNRIMSSGQSSTYARTHTHTQHLQQSFSLSIQFKNMVMLSHFSFPLYVKSQDEATLARVSSLLYQLEGTSSAFNSTRKERKQRLITTTSQHKTSVTFHILTPAATSNKHRFQKIHKTAS